MAELTSAVAGDLGVLLDHKEDYDGAEQHYRRAIAIDPEYADAHYNPSTCWQAQ